MTDNSSSRLHGVIDSPEPPPPSRQKCKKCGKFANIPCHTELCIDCYFNPNTKQEEKTIKQQSGDNV